MCLRPNTALLESSKQLISIAQSNRRQNSITSLKTAVDLNQAAVKRQSPLKEITNLETNVKPVKAKRFPNFFEDSDCVGTFS